MRKGVRFFICNNIQKSQWFTDSQPSKGDQEVCINAGMDDYIRKPVKLDELPGMLEKYDLPHIYTRKSV